MNDAWKEALKGFRTHLRNKYNNQRTRDLYWSSVAEFAEWFRQDPEDARLDDLREYLARRNWTANTRKIRQRAFRHFFEWAKRIDRVAIDPTVGWDTIQGDGARTTAATRAEVDIAVKNSAPRVRLMVELAADAGLTPAEIAAVHTRDLVINDGDWMLKVRSRGGGPDVVLTHSLGQQIEDADAGYLFPYRDTHLQSPYVTRLISHALPSYLTATSLRRAYQEGQAGRRLSWRDAGHYRSGTPSRISEAPDLTDNKMLQAELHAVARNLDRKPPQAIQNCKRILESLFKTVLFDLTGEEPSTPDLPPLFAQVAKALDIQAKSVPSHVRGSASVKAILQSLTTSVQSIAELRNTIGDDHGARFVSPAEARHAHLAFNATVTVAEFVLDTWRIAREQPQLEE